MTFRIGTNVGSLGVLRQLADTTAKLSRSSEHLASGLRINRASDDAAGLSIAESLNFDTRVLAQATRNVNDGISLLDVSAGALTELQNIVQRQRELATQAANSILSQKQRSFLQSESNALTNEYNRIISTTSFNNIQTLDGQTSSIAIQAGQGASATIILDFVTKLGVSVTGGSQAVTYYAPSGTAEIDSFVFGGAAQTATMTISGNDANSINSGDYVTFSGINASGVVGNFYIWFRKDGAGSDPTPTGTYVNKAVVDITSGQSYGTVSGLIDTAILSIAGSYLSGGGNVYSPAPGGLPAPSSNNPAINMGFTNGSGLASGDYIAFSTTAGSYYAYVGTNPNLAGRTGILVSANIPYATDSEIVDAFASAISAAVPEVTAISDGSSNLTITNNATGAVASAPFSYARDGVFYNGGGTTGITSAIDISTDQITIAGHGMTTGLQITIGTDDTLPSPLSSGTYYAIAVDANHIKIATSLANALGGIGVNLTDVGAGTMQIDATIVTVAQPLVTTISAVDISTTAAARNSLTTLSTYSDRVNSTVGAIGSSQSRLSSVLSVIGTTRLSYEDARSRIIDVDVATEAATHLLLSIRQKAAAALLAQVNKEPELALALLGGGRKR